MGLLVRLAGQWVAGERREDALRVARAVNARGVGAIINHLGEHYRDRAAVDATLREYRALLEGMRNAGVRGSVSVKPTQFGILFDREYALERLAELLEAARADGRMLWLDMEAASTKEDTLWVYERLLDRRAEVGVCLQANLHRTREDLRRLLRRGGRIRLTKGAYRETPEVAYARRADIDREFLARLEELFQAGGIFAVASHDERMIAKTVELAAKHPVPFEFQMLQGVRASLATELASKGHRVSEYIPYGPNWLPYFSRRLRERPRNVVTMVRSFVEE